jgi:tricorn protease
MRRLLPALLLVSFYLTASDYLFRNPALSRTQIVFSYAGDLWSVPRAGGEAKRLTAAPGVETDPVFSPDGTQIAFTGEYDGNVDVFVMPASGGTPRRLTYHPDGDEAVGWTPDGKRVLFASSRSSAMDGWLPRLFTIPLEGGFPDEIPLPIADQGSYSPDGSHLAYVPVPRMQEAWKRYRGGNASKIWIADLSDSSVVPIPRENSNDFNPMWAGDKIYFLSDRNGPVTLFSYDTKSKKVKQLIENHGLDFKSASAGPGAIVYEQFGSLNLYDLASGKSKPVKIRLAGDFPEIRPHFVNVGKRLRNPDISPSGARAVFQARGEILTVPAEKGDARNLTNTPGANERDPAWSPDGETIAYFSDESGEYMLHLRNQNGMGEVGKIKLAEKPSYYSAPRWSPDSKKIAYSDNHTAIWYIDVKQKKPVLVDKGDYIDDSNRTVAWSPDNKWLAFAKHLKSRVGAIYLYSLADGKSNQVTDGLSDADNSVFDKNGKYLYFTASTDSGPAREADLQSDFRRVTSSIYLVVLSKVQASPLAPESDDEKGAAKKEDKSKDEKDKDKKDDKDKDKKVEVKIDFDNIGQRILALPMPARRYSDLAVGKEGMLYAVESPDDGQKTVYSFDMAKRKEETMLSGVEDFRIAFNGEKVLYRKGDTWAIGAPKADDRDAKQLRTDGLEVRVEPRTEWNQIYHEVWRIEREYFYDPNYHGLDLKAAEKRYAPYLENLASRQDLNYLFEEMLGEFTVGHMYIGGGDSPWVKHVETGLLGADYKIENGRYRFARVYNGENWNPDLRAPLTQPGVNVAAGEYLLAVNGRELRAADSVYSFFEGTAGKQVVLKVGPDPSGAKSREVTVMPVSNEFRLRKRAWIEDNRRKVDQMTNGRAAYIYMPDTAQSGYTSFNRYFFAQLGKEAAIIDERCNHGGHFATDIIDYLKRPLASVITFRDGADSTVPVGAIFGPKVMIINEFAGSGGDAMPWYFRRFDVGKLVGKRTWGGLVGIGGYPELMDGGHVTAPSAGIWNPNGQYDVENRGVAPDIEVELDPKAMRQGHDPQLEKAVEVVMAELARHPLPQLKRPPYPNYHAK